MVTSTEASMMKKCMYLSSTLLSTCPQCFLFALCRLSVRQVGHVMNMQPRRIFEGTLERNMYVST